MIAAQNKNKNTRPGVAQSMVMASKKPKVIVIEDSSEEDVPRATSPTQPLDDGEAEWAAMDEAIEAHEKSKRTKVVPKVEQKKTRFVDYPSDSESSSGDEDSLDGSAGDDEEDSDEDADEDEEGEPSLKQRLAYVDDAMNDEFPEGRGGVTERAMMDLARKMSLTFNEFEIRAENVLKLGLVAFAKSQAAKKVVPKPVVAAVIEDVEPSSLPFEVEEDGKGKRFRSFAFTGNNMDTEARRDLEGVLKAAGAIHIVMGMEKGASGTPHIQGNVYWGNAKTFKAARTILKGCHVSATRMIEKSVEYCKKEGNFTEWGTLPLLSAKARGKMGGEKEKIRWSTALNHLKAGRMELVDPQIQVQHFGNLLKIKDHYMAQVWPQYRFDLRECFWFFGKAGTGKTRMAKKMLGGHEHRAYYKVPDTGKWFDNVNLEQSVIIMDDFAPDHTRIVGAMMKQWYDSPMCRVETKGGSVMVNFAAGVVTSNYRLDQCFSGVDYEAMARRFVQVFFGEKDTTPAGMIHSSALPRYFKHLVVMAKEGAEATHVRRQEEDEKPLAFTHESHKVCVPEDEGEEFEEE